jgi:hypothetical protein
MTPHRYAVATEAHRIVHTVVVAPNVRKEVESERDIALPRIFYSHPFKLGINFRDSLG